MNEIEFTLAQCRYHMLDNSFIIYLVIILIIYGIIFQAKDFFF